MKINIFWFRRDLRLEDNTGLNNAMDSGFPVLPIFIFDDEIIMELPADDARISFIYSRLSGIDKELRQNGSSLYVLKGKPDAVFRKIIASFDINTVFVNKEYEPYAIKRDNDVRILLETKGIRMQSFRDQVIFGENDVLKPDKKPYTIFTPYCKKWLSEYSAIPGVNKMKRPSGLENFYKSSFRFPSLEETGFRKSIMTVRPYDLSAIKDYAKLRDLPAEDKTSYLSAHLRFGTVSIRYIVELAMKENPAFLNELIWREFFMQILFHFPYVVTENFRPAYDGIQWRNNENEFKRWCQGETGYPIVDAGMRQLNETGFMHNRVRMITSGFLCKDLLIDWRWGEAYFAEKLLDYELSSNNGNWQWAAGTGCDAASYFRVFNPETQQKKFDPKNEYVRRWVKDFEKPGYPERMVDHNFAYHRVIAAYKNGIKTSFRKS
jgi:deoxyribodipyrimidine photo-lyase